MIIFWFRRDLRLNDNHGLYKALKYSNTVLPIFIYDTNITNKLEKNDHRLKFISDTITDMNSKLHSTNNKIYTFKGKPSEVLSQLIKKYKIKAIFFNKDYEPYARERDQDIIKMCDEKSVSCHSFKDHVVFEKDEIIKNDGTPYVVYTPYSKKWLEKFKESKLESYNSENHLHNLVKANNIEHADFNKTFNNEVIYPKNYVLNNNIIDKYEDTRNFPALDSTSRVGVHLRFGTLSLRNIVNKSSKSFNNTYLKELIWREFFIQILWHYPHTINTSFKEKYERIKWRTNMNDFKLWCDGKTGYPIVDAGMNELNKTGFMHNRLRMIVGSFLCKHLLIDWRLGEKYFADKLFDYEQASNVGNWQWVAGCGVDAAPYFRIFNPESQQIKFDKQKEYIKKWIPEFDESNYIEKIVDHKFARERCLKTYKEALN